MRFKRATAVITALLLGVCCTYARAAAAAPNLSVDGFFTAFRTKPQSVNGVTMMAMREIADYANVIVSWADITQTATLTKGQMELVLTVGAKRAYLNKEPVDLPAAPMYNNGQVMADILVPMRFVAETFGVSVGWEEKANTIILTTGKDPMKIMDINQPATPNAIVMDYDEALSSAYDANSSLLNLKESIDVINEKHSDLLDTINILGYVADLNSQQFTDALRALRQLENTMENIPYNEQMVRESTEYMLRNTLSSIATDEMDLQILKENINLQTTNVKNTQLKLELGMVSSSTLKTAEQELEQSKVNQEILELKIADERSSLGQILLMPMDREIIINFTPSVETLPQPNLSALIADSANTDPTLKLKETALKEAQYAVDTYNDTMTESKLEKENNLIRASRDYDDAKRNLEAAIRAAYNKINQIQQNQKSLEINLEKAKDTYKTLSANYQAGLVALYDLDAGRVAILKAETDIAKNAYTFWTLSFGLAHPYLMVGSSSSSAASDS
ncbi:MAG: TolC family protein [Clostridiales bacterium]|jgi:hypothetical protein|nr:TolC family protein [Clostridiales bacterium]